jgi:hypothetical protein
VGTYTVTARRSTQPMPWPSADGYRGDRRGYQSIIHQPGPRGRHILDSIVKKATGTLPAGGSASWTVDEAARGTDSFKVLAAVDPDFLLFAQTADGTSLTPRKPSPSLYTRKGISPSSPSTTPPRSAGGLRGSHQQADFAPGGSLSRLLVKGREGTWRRTGGWRERVGDGGGRGGGDGRRREGREELGGMGRGGGEREGAGRRGGRGKAGKGTGGEYGGNGSGGGEGNVVTSEGDRARFWKNGVSMSAYEAGSTPSARQSWTAGTTTSAAKISPTAGAGKAS